MQKEDIKPLIIILIFFALISGIVYFISNKDKKYLGTDQAPVLIPNEQTNKVNDYQTFFTVKGIIEKYQSSLTNNDSQAVLNYLSEQYIKENNLTIDNVLNYANNIDNKTQFMPRSMTKIEGENVTTIVVEGYNYNNNDTITTYYQINLDYNNMTYNIAPLSQTEYKDKSQQPNQIDSVNPNEDNNFSVSVPTDLDICALYLSSYKYYVNFNPSYIYNRLVNDNYESEEEFQTYINKNITKINSSYITKYRNYLDDSRSNYVCIDNNNITYTFYENFIMNYNLSIK